MFVSRMFMCYLDRMLDGVLRSRVRRGCIDWEAGWEWGASQVVELVVQLTREKVISEKLLKCKQQRLFLILKEAVMVS
jgi:hypothetical protein